MSDIAWILQEFVKYQSLGNDFILFHIERDPADLLSKGAFQQWVERLCSRHLGIGADGMLLLHWHKEMSTPEMFMWNLDGSRAELCLNGLRCVADFLFTRHSFPGQFEILCSGRAIQCEVVSTPYNGIETRTNLPAAIWRGSAELMIADKTISGDIMDLGNPHFVVSSPVDPAWLHEHGAMIESHAHFPNRTNVEFVWPTVDPSVWNVLLYERGAGMTLASGSGAAAVLSLLVQRKRVPVGRPTCLRMPGGSVTGQIESNGVLTLQASGHCVFQGTLISSLQLNCAESPQAIR